MKVQFDPTHQFDSQLINAGSRLYGFHVLVPLHVASTYGNQQQQRVWCQLDALQPYQCALKPIGEMRTAIMVNKARRTLLGLQEGATIHVSLMPDNSQYGLPIPAVTEELLKQDKELHQLFHKLTPGKQRSLLYIINQGKSEDIQLRRSLAIGNHLRKLKGKIDFKKLQEDLKQ